jgi:hypothetical protein
VPLTDSRREAELRIKPLIAMSGFVRFRSKLAFDAWHFSVSAPISPTVARKVAQHFRAIAAAHHQQPMIGVTSSLVLVCSFVAGAGAESLLPNPE